MIDAGRSVKFLLHCVGRVGEHSAYTLPEDAKAADDIEVSALRDRI